VSAEELERLARAVEAAGERYDEENLEGARIDCDYGLGDFGFTRPEIVETGQPTPMVVYRCRPEWDAMSAEEIVSQLEDSWETVGSFKHEAHTIHVGAARISLDFVTWWNDYRFYTGRIEVLPARQRRTGRCGSPIAPRAQASARRAADGTGCPWWRPWA
jgi:hypothetical protein